MTRAMQLLATIGCAMVLYGVWSRRLVWAWIGIFVIFAGCEALGVLWRATLSGHLWALYAVPVLGALVFTGSLWIAWHIGLEHVYAPQLKAHWWDDVVLAAAAFLTALGSILAAGRRRFSRNRM